MSGVHRSFALLDLVSRATPWLLLNAWHNSVLTSNDQLEPSSHREFTLERQFKALIIFRCQIEMNLLLMTLFYSQFFSGTSCPAFSVPLSFKDCSRQSSCLCTSSYLDHFIFFIVLWEKSINSEIWNIHFVLRYSRYVLALFRRL